MRTKKEVRAAFADLGLKVSIVQSAFEGYVVLKSKDFPFRANCFDLAFIKKHQAIFNLWNSLKINRTIFDTGEKLL